MLYEHLIAFVMGFQNMQTEIQFIKNTASTLRLIDRFKIDPPYRTIKRYVEISYLQLQIQVS